MLEKDIALILACKVHAYLQGVGVKSFLTRTRDETVLLAQRAARAFKGKADMLVSIHVNSAPSNKMHGIEALCIKQGTRNNLASGNLFINMNDTPRYGSLVNTFFNNNVARSHRLAESILQNMVSAGKEENLNLHNRGLKYNGWQVLLHSNIPATIVEVGFMSNPREAMLLVDGVYQELLSYGIAQGITRFMGAKK